MWGTSSRGDELTGDFANELDAISTDDRGLFRLSAGKLSQGNLGLLQQNRPLGDIATHQSDVRTQEETRSERSDAIHVTAIGRISTCDSAAASSAGH